MKGALLGLFGLIAASTFGDWIYYWWHGPLHLACHGQLVTTYQGSDRNQTKTLHVDVDPETGIVAIENFRTDYKIQSDGRPDELSFSEGTLGTDKNGGNINRYTGSISVSSILPGGSVSFDGLCQPVERMF